MSREAFENWAKAEYPNWGSDLLSRQSDGSYCYVQKQWEGWQAASQASPAPAPIDDATLLRFLNVLHRNVPEDERPLSMSDLSDEQAARVRDAIATLRAAPAVEPVTPIDEGWKEAAIAWTVCASVHEEWAKDKDALYKTRHADFERHAEDARKRALPTTSQAADG